MAKDEIHKKWGTIFMGEREASVEQLDAMQEPLRRERQQKAQAEDYMERVRARAADRAREILGAAYAERQKVLEEAKAEAQSIKRQGEEEAARLKSEGDTARKMAQAELARAETERAEAEKIRAGAHEAGIQAGMEQAAQELHEFRGELGRSLAVVLHAIERERVNILDFWRDDLVQLVQCAAQAGTGMVLAKEHETILKALVMQALNLLENRVTVTVRVNPAEEGVVSDMFRAARERYPELRQWIVNGDETIEPGGLVAESGSGSVDLRRSNFRELVDGIMEHLGLPGDIDEDHVVRELVEKEVAHIASLTPEMELPPVETPEEPEPQPETLQPDEPEPEPLEPPVEAEILPDAEEAATLLAQELEQEILPVAETEVGEALAEDGEPAMPPLPGDGVELAEAVPPAQARPEPSLQDLEEELFPLDEMEPESHSPLETNPVSEPRPAQPASSGPAQPRPQADPKTLAEGGFL